jgi:hypothetical protein
MYNSENDYKWKWSGATCTDSVSTNPTTEEFLIEYTKEQGPTNCTINQ